MEVNTLHSRQQWFNVALLARFFRNQGDLLCLNQDDGQGRVGSFNRAGGTLGSYVVIRFRVLQSV